MCYEQKNTGNLMEGEQGLGSSEEDDTRVENAAAEVSNEHGVANQASNAIQISQQSQNSAIRWERFLPIRSLKVLLVENDDSTRHVVSALLRNCSYEVTAVPNGFQAWRILEDINNHIDLVLTEVVMPILSGIGLLCKIMNHKSLKNIPVIMMSSQDSIGVVFKCLSKGAVDFLVKPIRKNELKNLWQHVWRRCHSSSGSGSESGTGKSPKSKSNEESENNSDSSEELEDNGSTGQSNHDGSDNGSGTQSSWTKRAVEYDSPQALSPSYQFADAPDSTCAQVIHAKPETLGNMWVHAGETKVCQQKDEKLDDVMTGKDMKTGASRNAEKQQHDRPCENLSSQTSSKRQNKFSEADSKPLENGQIEHNTVNLSTKTRDPSPKAIGIITNYMDPHAESEKLCDLNGVSDISQPKDKAHSGCGESPCLELGLKRPGGVEGVNPAGESLNILKHSDLSAFSKYNTASSANQVPTGDVGSSSLLDQSSVAIKTETVHNFPFHISGTVVNQQSNGSSNNNDMASTAKTVPTKLEAFSDKLESSSAFKSFHSSAFQPVQNGCTCPPQKPVLGKSEDVDVDTVQLKYKGSHQQIQVQHHHHHHHHYHHHVHKMRQHQPHTDHDDQLLKNMAAAAPQCGSSNVLGGPTEANAGNYSMNGSASGSNHGSNGQNGGNTALNVGLTNVESEHRAAGNSAVGVVGGKTSGNVLDEDRAAQREAALSKFRQKRKERCFEKRVRYQSRKRLAEQRPRVKGQFVRQIASDSKTERDCQGNDVTSEDNSSDNVR